MLFLPPSDSGALEVEEIEQQLPLDIIPQEIRATLGEFVPGLSLMLSSRASDHGLALCPLLFMNSRAPAKERVSRSQYVLIVEG
ncbi:MAG: hypothetical protein BRC53_09205 [Cyanobacteria bacterium SW_6_48_11]|nr:MAG: hypothetical protein BRC53_09205 [Cyanobacteria bacterium SW_6_48_11]